MPIMTEISDELITLKNINDSQFILKYLIALKMSLNSDKAVVKNQNHDYVLSNDKMPPTLYIAIAQGLKRYPKISTINTVVANLLYNLSNCFDFIYHINLKSIIDFKET